MNALNTPLAELDPEAHAALRAELHRQQSALEMISSENFAPSAVPEAQGDAELDGRQAEDLLHEIGITVNRNAVPFDPRPPVVTSGLRIGTPALATRGCTEEDFTEVSDVIALALQPEPHIGALRARTEALAAKHPLHPHLSAVAEEAGAAR